MNVLFLSLIDFNSIDEKGIYTDLLREFWKHGDKLYIISPIERRQKRKKVIISIDNITIIKPVIFDMQKVGYAKKAISLFSIESILMRTIKHDLAKVKMDLVLYATPPISFYKPVAYIKSRDKARSYLLQKDIFPEGLLDLQVLTETGIKGVIYKYYRKKEEKLLKISDRIGCMSNNNVTYIKTHNPFINPEIIELCPNSIEVTDKSVKTETKVVIRNKYGIPQNKVVFVYGGNLGKPQGIPFLIECLKQCINENVFFLIVGNGTEYHLIDKYLRDQKPQNVKLMKHIPKDDYDNMVGACDVGMIFLDHRFTVPNIPSRLLSYMQAKIPVLACTDTSTDIKEIIEEGKFGCWCESNSTIDFCSTIECFMEEKTRMQMGANAFDFLMNNYSSNKSYMTIIKSVALQP